MVTRAATSGKGKFVPMGGTFVPCGKEIAERDIRSEMPIIYTPYKKPCRPGKRLPALVSSAVN